MANASVGGLFVTVSLDTKRATAQLAAMGATFSRALSTGSAARSASNATRSLNNVTVAAKGATTQLSGLRGGLSKLSNSFTTFGRSVGSGGSRALGQMSAAAGGLSKSLSTTTAASIASSAAVGAIAVSALAAAAAIGALVIGTYKLGKAGFDVAKDLELLDISLTQILGSSRAAKAEMNALIAVAAESPFLTPAVIEMDKFLLSQGLVSAEIRGNLIPAILDMAAAYGLGTENLRSISYAMAQVQSRGYLSGDELRQLANQLVPVWDILREIPALAELSQSEIRKLSEQGQISAEAFQLALTAFAQDFGGAAKAAAETVKGLTENIRDIATIRIGKAFLDLRDVEGAVSPLSAIQRLLLSIKELVQDVDFGPLAASMGLFVEAFTGEASRFLSSSTEAIVHFMEVSLPNAIRYSASVMNVLVESFSVGIQFVSKIIGAITNAFGIMQSSAGNAIGGWATYWKFAAGTTALAGGFIIAIIQAVASAIGALVAILTFNFAAAGDSARQFGQAFGAGLDFVRNAYTSMATTIDAAGKIKIPKIGERFGDELDGFQKGMGERAKAVDEGNGAGGATKKVTDDIAKAMDLLWDLTRRWQGFRSELERGLLGKTGFEATLDQIINMGKRVHEALLIIGDTRAADAVAAATLKLHALATERAVVVESLKQAEADLKSIIADRERFASDLRRSAIAFAAALDLETETTKRWELQSDRGFFIESEQTKAKSFVETLRERGKALKEFFANIKELQDKGLDEDFIKSLLVAGPEASGEVAAALAAGGQAMIDEVNVLYGDIEETAGALGDYGAEKFYDAGVAQAEALAEGLQAELDGLTLAAETLTDIIFTEAEAWAKELKDAGKAAGKGAASGLGSTSAAISASAAGLTSDVENQFSGLTTSLALIGAESGVSFSDALEAALENGDYEDAFTTILDDFEQLAKNIEQIFNVVDLVLKWDWRAIRKAFFGGIVKMLKDLGGGILNALGITSAYNRLSRSIGGAVSGYSYGSSSASGLGVNSLSGFAADQVDTQVSALGGESSTQGFGVASSQNYEPVVKVYIGDEELRGIVRTEVVYHDEGESSRVLTGRRV